MQKINLRELYPDVYKTDVFVDVAEEVVAAIRGQEQDDAAYERRKFRHKAHYSLNREDGIENDALNRPLTPAEVLEQKLLREEVYKLSRFGRNAADILNSLELVQSYGVNLICIEEGIDSSQTSGKLLISVLSAVAEIERENIIEQTMNGRREKARQGGWNGGFAPYGYTLEDNKLMI